MIMLRWTEKLKKGGWEEMGTAESEARSLASLVWRPQWIYLGCFHDPEKNISFGYALAV